MIHAEWKDHGGAARYKIKARREGRASTIVARPERAEQFVTTCYSTLAKRFSISRQLRVFHQAARYSLRRFWYFR